MATTSIVKPEPLELSGSSLQADEDNLSSSIARMPADELHKELIRTYVNIGESCIAYQALVNDAKVRMYEKHEKVGGCETWTDYADCYLKREDESLPTCLRRLRRALEGKNPDTKHRNKRKKFKSNRQVVDEGLDRQHAIELKQEYETGFSDGEKAGAKKAEFAAAKKPKQLTLASVPPSLTEETYYIIRRKSDGALLLGQEFLIIPSTIGIRKPLTISDVVHFQSPDKTEYEKAMKTTKRLCKQAEKKFDANGYEWIKVEAVYTLTSMMHS